MRQVLLAAAFLFAAAGCARAQPHPVGSADIAKLPATDVTVAFQTEHGPGGGHYAGPLLWAVLGADGLIPPGPAKTRLIHSVVITGRDGYAVAVAIGEIDPAFEGKAVILATRQDDHPIGHDEVRLVVPGDKHGGRSVHDVVAIELR